MKARWVVLVLAVCFLSAAGFAAVGVFGIAGRHSPVPTPPVRPFTDLDTAIADAAPEGWELHRSPSIPGPCRLLPGGMMLGRGEGRSMTCRVTNADGVVTDELRLESTPEYDQEAVFLETIDGRRTIAVLKRAR